MKKLVSLIVVLALALSACLCGTALGEDKIKIGVSFAQQQSPRFAYDEMYMRQVVEAQGGELIVQGANYVQATQEAQVENMLSQGIDVLILVAVSTNMSALVDKVKAEGVPVVCYDNFIENADLDAYLDRDNHAAGRDADGSRHGSHRRQGQHRHPSRRAHQRGRSGHEDGL